jgi:site-specific recombinase XerD
MAEGMMNKQQIISGIVGDLSSCLSVDQLEKISGVLNYRFRDVDFIVNSSRFDRRATDNSNLLFMFISAKRLEGLSEKSLYYYESTARALLCKIEKPLWEITPDDVRNYLADYYSTRKISRLSLENIRRNLSSFFAWLENENYIVRSPLRRVHKIKTEKTIKEAITDEGIERLRNACGSQRDRAMFEMLVSTGMRVSEMAGLDRADINFSERECVVFGKGSKERTVYLDARAKIHLQLYLESRDDDNPALFVELFKPHDRLQISGIEICMRKLGKKAGLNKIHPHKFRRTMATMAIDKGMPIEQVQKLLGHENIDTTLRYAMVSQANVKNSHKKYLG